MRLLFLLFIFLSSSVHGQSIRVATYTYGDNTRLQNLESFANDLEYLAGLKVEISSYKDVQTLQEAILKGWVDVAFINTLGYLQISKRAHTMAPVARMVVPEKTANAYKSVVLFRKDKAFSESELKLQTGKLRLALVNPGSTSGNLYPRMYFSSMGIDDPEKQFKSLNYVGNHTLAIQKLLANEFDLAAVGHDAYLDYIQKNPSLEDKIGKLWLSDEIPLGPVLVNINLHDELKRRIKSLLLNLHVTSPPSFEALKAGWIEAQYANKFLPVSSSDYHIELK